jgi:hypothetical protein
MQPRVSIAPPKAGRGTECARPALSVTRRLRPLPSGIVSLKVNEPRETVPQSVPVSILN